MSGLNSIYEHAHNGSRTDNTNLGMLASFVGVYTSRDEEQGGCPSDTKRKGPKTREYPMPLFDLRRLVGPKGAPRTRTAKSCTVLQCRAVSTVRIAVRIRCCCLFAVVCCSLPHYLTDPRTQTPTEWNNTADIPYLYYVPPG